MQPCKYKVGTIESKSKPAMAASPDPVDEERRAETTIKLRVGKGNYLAVASDVLEWIY